MGRMARYMHSPCAHSPCVHSPCAWRSEDNLQMLFSPFTAWIPRFELKCLPLLTDASHLGCPEKTIPRFLKC